MALEIISTTSDLDVYGGAQKVLMDLHNGIKYNYSCKVLGFKKFEDLHPKYKIDRAEYVKFGNPFYLNDKILIVHARNVMAFIMLVKRLFFLNTKIIYVAHNVYDTHRYISFFPHDIISISKKVTDNLLNYFSLKNHKITLIYNGIKDEGQYVPNETFKKEGKIVILYSARVNDVKRQLLIADELMDKLDPRIEIWFAGMGPDQEKLAEKCAQTQNLKTLGFIENVNEIVKRADFLMLFSIQEGLPISLIEGIMHGKPLLVNDVGGNLELGVPGLNGIELAEDWKTLADKLNSLINLTDQEYQQMSFNSRAHYEEMFTYDAMLVNYKKAIAALQQ